MVIGETLICFLYVEFYAVSSRRRKTSQAVWRNLWKKCTFGRQNCRCQSDIKMYL